MSFHEFAANHRFQWIESDDAVSMFCGCFQVLCSYQVYIKRSQPLKRVVMAKKMKKMTNYLLGTLTIFISIIISCVPSSYHSPKVLKPGEKTLGIGYAFSKKDVGDFSTCFRYGVFHRMDCGLKMIGHPAIGYGVFFDTKYGFMEHPFLLSGDLGFMTFADLYAPDYEFRAYGFHPTLFFGRDRLYGGIGWNYMLLREVQWPMSPEGPFISTSRVSSLRVLIGASWGKRWKFNPEIILTFPSRDRYTAPVIAGFGFHRGFIKKHFTFTAGLAVPTGRLSKTQKIGFEVGGMARISTGIPAVRIAVGASYIMFCGKSEWADFKPFELFVGPHFGKEKGAYFSPAITGSFDKYGNGIGLDLGAGVLVPISKDNARLDLGVRYSLMNMIAKEQGARSASAFRLRMGVTF